MTTLPVGNDAVAANAGASVGNTLGSVLGASNPIFGVLGVAGQLASAAAGGPSSAVGAADSGAPINFGSVAFGGNASSGSATDSNSQTPSSSVTDHDISAGNPLAQGLSANNSLSANPLLSGIGGLIGGASAPANLNPGLVSRVTPTNTPIVRAVPEGEQNVEGFPVIAIAGAAALILGAYYVRRVA